MAARDDLLPRCARAASGCLLHNARMAQADHADALDRLYAAALEDFVAERARLARELRQSGDRPAATALAKVAKPSAAAWALNHLARDDAKALAAWLDAAEVLRDASTRAADVGGDALRAAMAAHRTATSELVAHVRDTVQPGGKPLSDPMLERVRAVLQAATADEDVAERLKAGRVTEEAEPADEEAELLVSLPESQPQPEGKPKPSARDRKGEEKAQRKAELEARVRDAEQALERLREEAAERKSAAEAADERADEARRTLHRSESEAEAAHAALDDAADAVKAAERDLKPLRASLRRA